MGHKIVTLHQQNASYNRQVSPQPELIESCLSHPLISVIIPHYNDLNSLDECLALLSKQTLASDKFEIIVVDNNSTVGIKAVQTAVGDLATVIQALEQGAAMARNAGAAIAQGQLLAFIDSDCRPALDWLEKGYEAISNSQSDIVGGYVKTIPSDPNAPNAVEAFELIFAFQNEVYIKEVGFSVTANMFVKKSVFQHVGNFRKGLSEDKDWGQRAGKMGCSLDYKDTVVVDHPARSNWLELTKKWKRLTREEYLLRKTKKMGKLNWCWYALLILVSPLIHSVKILKFRGLNPNTKVSAAFILFRIRFYRFNEACRLLFQGE